MTAFSIMFFPPVFYAVFEMRSLPAIFSFSITGIFALVFGMIFLYLGRNHRKKLPVTESAFSILTIYPIVAIFGAIPFILSGRFSVTNSFLETVSNFTSAGLSLIPANAPYIFRIWQSLQMWYGSLIFLVMLVTILPEVGGNFGIALSLRRGQNFSPMFGQMREFAGRMVKIYAGLTGAGFLLFKAAGLNFWDSLLMAMRCISTGGGDFFPERNNFYVEYAAAATMFLACGNFLLYFRTIHSIIPPFSQIREILPNDPKAFLIELKREFLAAVKLFFKDSEVKTLAAVMFICTGFVFFSVLMKGFVTDGNIALRYALFHVISFMSTSGISLAEIETAHDFDRFLIFLTAIIGGSIGSISGGLKIMRILILLKFTKTEIKKTLHPQMFTAIRVNKIPVPPDTIGRILGFFFLSAVTLFICAGILSIDANTSFSESVAMVTACLTNVGNLPGICGAENFLQLSIFGKIFCMFVLIIGRVEIFALLIVVAGLKNLRGRRLGW